MLIRKEDYFFGGCEITEEVYHQAPEFGDRFFPATSLPDNGNKERAIKMNPSTGYKMIANVSYSAFHFKKNFLKNIRLP